MGVGRLCLLSRSLLYILINREKRDCDKSDVTSKVERDNNCSLA